MSADGPAARARRRALGWLTAGPLWPLAWPAQATPRRPPEPARVEFSSMAAPGVTEPAALAAMTTASTVQWPGADGSGRSQPLRYQPLFITGDAVPDGQGGWVVAGGCVDAQRRPLVDRSVRGRERQFFSDCPDGMTLIRLERANVPGVAGHPLFAVVQFEYVSRDQAGERQYGRLPSPLAVLTLDQDPANGRLRLVKYHNVDTSPVHGLWLACAASRSPWNTHLASEEYEPDAAWSANPYLRDFSRHFFGDPERANPYHYGHLPEVTVRADGSAQVRKHYGMGRISREVVQVMADERTVLMGDDWINGGLFLYVADRARDLSRGALYVARWQQTSGVGPGAARLSWIRLGHADSDAIEALVDGGIRVADILDIRDSAPAEPGFTSIPFAGRTQWVRLKPGMAQAAAFLETHRYAALVGASLGFSKMEGVAVNTRDRIAYVAMSRIERSMLDGSGHIRVEGPTDGAVYALTLRGAQRDQDGRAIDSDWVPIDMAAVPALIGGDRLRQPDALGNRSDPQRLSQPDNLAYSEALRVLFIGEDSSTHVNNFVWAYHVDSGRLSRVLSCPVGAEATGLYVADDLNGWTYLSSSFQHVGELPRGLPETVRSAVKPLLRANYRDGFGAAVGYLGTREGALKLSGR